MFRDFLSESDLLHFPVVAMLIFFLVFLSVVIYALAGLRRSRTVSRIAALPFDDEDSILSEEVR